MFVHAFDIVHVTAVWLFTGTSNTDDDWQTYVDTIHAMKAKSVGRHMPAAIQIVDPGAPNPNAAWRRKMAEASATFEGALFALVSPSIAVRGVATAINWLRPPPYELGVHSEFDAAVAWVESRRGERLPSFYRLLGEVRLLARSRSEGEPR